MTREERTVLLAVLVPIVFGGLMFIEKGSFIVPFPLNESIFLIVSLSFLFRVGKHFKAVAIFSTAFAIFNLLATDFFWSFLLPQQSLYAFSNGGTLDLLKLFSAILLIIWAGYTLIKVKDLLSTILFLLFLMLFSAGIIFHLAPLEVIATLVPFASVFKYKEHFPYHLLWLLLSILGTMKLVMLSL